MNCQLFNFELLNEYSGRLFGTRKMPSFELPLFCVPKLEWEAMFLVQFQFWIVLASQHKVEKVELGLLHSCHNRPGEE